MEIRKELAEKDGKSRVKPYVKPYVKHRVKPRVTRYFLVNEGKKRKTKRKTVRASEMWNEIIKESKIRPNSCLYPGDEYYFDANTVSDQEDVSQFKFRTKGKTSQQNKELDDNYDDETESDEGIGTFEFEGTISSQKVMVQTRKTTKQKLSKYDKKFHFDYNQTENETGIDETFESHEKVRILR